MACGRRLTPTPTALTCGALSNTRQPMPRWASSSASVSPPIPPPTMRTSFTSGVYCEVCLFQCAIAGDFARSARRDNAPTFVAVRGVPGRHAHPRHLVDQHDGGRLGTKPVERCEQVIDDCRREA